MRRLIASAALIVAGVALSSLAFAADSPKPAATAPAASTTHAKAKVAAPAKHAAVKPKTNKKPS